MFVASLLAVVGQPSTHCQDKATRRNPCTHREVVCFLNAISYREVEHLRIWLRDESTEQKATNMGHRHNRSREASHVGTYPVAIEGRMSWQPVHVRTPRATNLVFKRVTERLEKLAKAAVKRRGWPMSLTKSDEDVFVAVYPEGRGFYHRHRDVLPYFSPELGSGEGSDLGASASTTATDLVSSIMDASLYPQAHRRVVSIVVQLAEGNGAEYTGGSLNVLTGTLDEPGLALPHVNAIRRGAAAITAPACPGDVIVHPAFTAHEVTPVTGGIRESLTWWIPGEPVIESKDEL